MNLLFAAGGMTVLLGVLGVIAAVVVGALMLFMNVYNELVQLRNRYQNGFSQIDVQLKRRYDLIPNLVETAKGYMRHEKETLEAVINARNAAYTAGQKAASNPGDPSAMSGLSGAEAQLNGALSRLMAVAEAYPDLKANQNMLALQEELTSTENKIAFARQAFNDSVMRYNNKREVFPNNIVANFANFQRAQFFEVESKVEREAPKVAF